MLMERTRGGDAALAAPPTPAAVGCVFALACLTRYEAWPVTVVALAMAAWIRRRAGNSWAQASVDAVRIGVLPAAAVVGFMAFSRVVIGEWFVSSGFFVPDNPAKGQPFAVAESILRGIDQLGGRGLLIAALLGLGVALAGGIVDRDRARAVLPWSLIASAALPFAAFMSGHPYRIRYMVPLIAAVAIGAGFLAGASRRARAATIAFVLIAAAIDLRPLSSTAPMVLEAQWDRPSARGRTRVTACLQAQHDGRLILASMSSLGHYMQELSHIGLRLRDFVHEGNGDAWQQALAAPGPEIGWILISEGTDGRDALWRPAQENPALLRGFSRVCEGGAVALYRRD
jgi:hypothetical protein